MTVTTLNGAFSTGGAIETSTPVVVVDVNGNPSGGGPSTPISFQKSATLSDAALTSNVYKNGVVIKALLTNTGTIAVGGAGVTIATGYPLTAGEAISYNVSDSASIHIIGQNTSDVVAVTGS